MVPPALSPPVLHCCTMVASSSITISDKNFSYTYRLFYLIDLHCKITATANLGLCYKGQFNLLSGSNCNSCHLISFVIGLFSKSNMSIRHFPAKSNSWECTAYPYSAGHRPLLSFSIAEPFQEFPALPHVKVSMTGKGSPFRTWVANRCRAESSVVDDLRSDGRRMIKLAQELSRKREEQNPTRLVQFRLGVDVRIAVTSDEGTVALSISSVSPHWFRRYNRPLYRYTSVWLEKDDRLEIPYLLTRKINMLFCFHIKFIQIQKVRQVVRDCYVP